MTQRRNKGTQTRKIAALALAFMMLFTVSINTLATAEGTSYLVSFYLQDGTQYFTYPGETGLTVILPAAPTAPEGFVFAYWYQVDAALQGDANKPFDLNTLIAAPLFLKALFLPVTPVVTAAPPVVTEAPPVVTEAPPVVTEAPPVVTEAPPVVTEAPPVVTEAPPVVTEAPPVLTEELVAEEPLDEELVAEEPLDEEPVVEEPVAEEPVAEEPVVEEPVAEEPVVEEPIYNEEEIIEENAPEAGEEVAESDNIEEPVAEEPVVEEPVVEEPVIQEFAEEESIEEEVVMSELLLEEYITEEPINSVEPSVELTAEPTAEPVTALVLPVGTLTFGGTVLNLYAQPDTNSEVLHVFDPATQVIVISQDELWSLIEYQGLQGYISRVNVVVENPVVRPQPSVYIWFANAPETIMDGDVLTLNAKLVGFEGLDYTIVWQRATMDGNRNVGNDWVDEYGANGLSHSYTVNSTTAFYAWRLAVTVTLPENVSFLEP